MGTTIDSQATGMEIALEGLRQRGYCPSVVYDIGAAEGGWANLAMRVWPEATVVCFEPLLERQDALRTLAASTDNRLRLQFCGVGDIDDELPLGVGESLYTSSFAYGTDGGRKTRVHRLDSLLAAGTIPAPNFIKIDVQGFEMRVLAGGPTCLSLADAVIMECQFFEFCSDMTSLDKSIAAMAAMGYVPYEFVEWLRRPLDGAMGQCDILFMRRDHALRADKRW